jgi:alpha-beta hydrolase superfamily lysophospholipase
VLTSILALALATGGALGFAIAFGGPAPVKALDSVNQPFSEISMDGLPPVQRFSARDGAALAYRFYPRAISSTDTTHRVVLVHGSSASSLSMHPLAQALAAQGFSVAALDMRGHGDSGPHGDVGYIGQLDDDLEDFMRSVPHTGSNTLMGFSLGGGFALRVAGGPRQQMFDRYVLLSPYLRHDAPTARAGDGGWVSVGVPRVIGLTLLNALGITQLNHLRVKEYALDTAARSRLTPYYSFALAGSFGPHDDYIADIAGAHGKVAVVAGTQDELFYADRFAATFAAAGNKVPVTLVPGLGHSSLTLQPAGHAAVVAACLLP